MRNRTSNSSHTSLLRSNEHSLIFNMQYLLKYQGLLSKEFSITDCRMYKEIFLNKSKQKAPSKLFLFKVVLPFQEIPSGTDAYK